MVPMGEFLDPVLGPGDGPVDAPVLGGAAAQWRLLQLAPDLKEQVSVLYRAMALGSSGIDLVIRTLTDRKQDWWVRYAAWELLRHSGVPSLVQLTAQVVPLRDVGGFEGLVRSRERGEKDFSFADLRGRRGNPPPHLGGLDLSFADLSGVDLGKTNLAYADLSGANLEGTRLQQARMENMLVSDETRFDRLGRHLWELHNHVHVPDRDMEGLQLPGALLGEMHLEGVNLRGADLGFSCLESCSLEGADLSHANLRSSLLGCAQLYRARLDGAYLQQADLGYARLDEASFVGANLAQARLERAYMQDTDLSHACLEGANLQGANLIGARLVGANLRGCNLIEAYLSYADLSGADLWGASLEHSHREGTIVRDTIFPGGSRRNRKIPSWW